MDITEMTRKEFDALPAREWAEDIGLFDSMVILPLRARHNSGFRVMDFVAVRKGEAICRLSGLSDVLHLNGIGGYGKDWLSKYGGVPKTTDVVDISIDCLPKSGLLHIFSHSHQMEADLALSSFCLFFSVERKNK